MLDAISRRGSTSLLCLMAAWCLASCATPPKVDAIVNQTPDAGTPTRVVNARGPLTQAEGKALIARSARNHKEADLLQDHLLIEQEIAETPLVAGNDVHLLRDGEQTFNAMFSLIRQARQHIHLEYFIFEDVQHHGESLGDLLIAKRKAGVAIDVIYDGIGSITTPPAFFERLRSAGVQVVTFNPIDLAHAPDLNNRDHRKILIVDGESAIVGGINLSLSYESSRLRRSAGVATHRPEHWRDTDLLIRGPAVDQLQRLFIQHWAEQHGPALSEPGLFPDHTNRGKEIVRIIGSSPEDALPRYYVTLLSAIRNAEQSIYLSSAYFVPTEDEKKDLIAAARRGVAVSIFVPGVSDSPAAIRVQHSHYEDLLEAGVKIYESEHEVLHAKTISIDGVWSVIGSSNIDHRSALLNAEVDVVVIGVETARELRAMFEDDIRQATPIRLDVWKKRPLWERIRDRMARFWEGML